MSEVDTFVVPESLKETPIGDVEFMLKEDPSAFTYDALRKVFIEEAQAPVKSRALHEAPEPKKPSAPRTRARKAPAK